MNMSLSPQPHDVPDIDGVLRDHFRQAMPAPWPAAPRVDTAVAVRESQTWSMIAARALAGATIVAIVVGYLGLASFFPREKANLLDPTSGPQIGHNPKLDPSKATPMPR
jgi:type VI protein secretion system component VasF